MSDFKDGLLYLFFPITPTHNFFSGVNSPTQPIKVVFKVGKKAVVPSSISTNNSVVNSPSSTSVPPSPQPSSPKKPIFVFKSQSSPQSEDPLSPQDKPTVKKVIFKTSVVKKDPLDTSAESRKRKSDEVSEPSNGYEQSKKVKSVETPFMDEGTVITAPKIKKYHPFKKVVNTIMKKLIDLDPASIFYSPVTEEQAPGYFSIIKRPMSLSVMRSRANADKYEFLSQMENDFKRICNNAMTYNAPDTYYHKKAVKFLQDGSSLFSKQALNVSPELLVGPDLVDSPVVAPPKPKEIEIQSPKHINQQIQPHHQQPSNVYMSPQMMTVNPDLIVQKLNSSNDRMAQPLKPMPPNSYNSVPMSMPQSMGMPTSQKDIIPSEIKIEPQKMHHHEVNPLMVDWNKKKYVT